MTRIVELSLKARAINLTLGLRRGIYAPSLMLLERRNGYWAFASGERILWGAGQTGCWLKERLNVLTLRRWDVS